MLLRDYYNSLPTPGYNKNEEEEKTGQATPVFAPPSVAPDAPDTAPAEQVNEEKQVNPVVDRLNQGQDLFTALLDSRYKESKEDLEKKRKAELIGNIAQLFGQGVSLNAGARQLAPIKSKIPVYNDKLERLKQWKDGIDINYTLNQARQDAAAKQQQAKIDWEKEKMAAGQHNKDRELELRAAELDWRVRQGKMTADQAREKLKLEREKLEETKRSNRAQEGIGAVNANANKTRADKYTSGRGTQARQDMSIVVASKDGKRQTVMIPKDKSGAVISLYNRMKEIVEQKNATRPEQDKINLDDINLQFGEGGDQATKALTIIQRRLQEFPELTDEFYQLVGVDKPKPVQRGSLLPGFGKDNNKKKPSLLQ